MAFRKFQKNPIANQIKYRLIKAVNVTIDQLNQCEEKSDIAERFIRTLNNKIYKYISSISKNVYIAKLDDLVNKYNNTYRSTIKMKPVDVKSSTYIGSSK